ncbi:glycosyltransferase [Oerskovia sp. Root22]|uniref:glycosyltransferase n=1 Tax=Oerskovia sp. Root22 TaxID=1736494 RepID=UPI0009E7F127|nr:glycosyltransferase [Oerskovia sp. Root22]
MSTTTMTTHANAAAHRETDRRVVHRVVLPLDRDLDVLPLYVDFDPAHGAVHTADPSEPVAEGAERPLPQRAEIDPEIVTGRHEVTLTAGERVSFGTYFNAFPASYWRRWTTVGSVRLSVEVDAPTTVVVYKSNARGASQRVEVLDVPQGTTTIDLTLAPFGDGGWYWFDLYAAAGPVKMLQAHWSVEVPAGSTPGTASIGITTFNRPDYCVAQLKLIGADDALKGALDNVFVIDQGNQLVEEEDGFAEAESSLEGRLKVIRQGNLGGSGGFARGMLETVKAEKSRYVLLLDDDIVSEPEGILRAIAFGDFTRRKTIVGGHMFSMYEKSVLHSFGEKVNPYRFFWGPVPGTGEGHNFANFSLRTTGWLHRRVDVDYNGWWMCLIPTDIVREIGLSLPVFIKWDDSEFGLRAKRAGYPTVSLPGAAVWHVPWTDKDDTIDWQAYYHQRNRWLAALLYSPYPRGGILPRESFQMDVKHLLSLQYSAIELRHQALEDLLSGPDHLHATIGSKLGHIRQVRSEYPDAVVQKDLGAFPDPHMPRPPRRGVEPRAPKGKVQGIGSALTGAVRQLLPVREGAVAQPETAVPATDAKWWRLSHLDSALVTSADGTGASWYQRDPEKFRSYLAHSVDLHRRLVAQWSDLQEQYRDAHHSFTAPEAWERTFAENRRDQD